MLEEANNIIQEKTEKEKELIANTQEPTIVEKTKVVEKTLTEEQVNSIVRNVKKKEQEKAAITNEELQRKIEAIEKEREAEKLDAQIRAKAFAETELLNKQNFLDKVVEEKVNESYKESITQLVKSRIDISKESNEKIKEVVSEIVSTFPAGVAKGTTNTHSTLNQVEVTPTQVQTQTNTQPAQTIESGYYLKDTNTKLVLTKEEYDKLPFAKKELIVVK